MKKLIVANWKMYMTLRQSVTVAKRISNFQIPISKLTMVLCPSFVALEEVAKVINPIRARGRLRRPTSNGIKLGAQDVEPEKRGAFTGEVGLDDLRELGVEYVLVGHSERRRMGEADSLINKKLKAVLKAGMKPILCVGELSRVPSPQPSPAGRGGLNVVSPKERGENTPHPPPLTPPRAGGESSLERRGNMAAQKYVANQLRAGLKGVARKDLRRVVVAYEPVWAIGTGRADSPEDASEMHGWIRKVVKKIYGGKASGVPEALPPVLYGGSVNSRNAKEFLRSLYVDGLLIGKASTKFSEFSKIMS